MNPSPRASFLLPSLAVLLSLLASVRGHAQQTTVISLGDSWKTNIPSADPGSAWRGTSFDDNVPFNGVPWNSGVGLFGFETAPLPAPGIQTAVGTTATAPIVYLFRKTFTFHGNPAGATFAIDQIVDDGVAYYLNGNLLKSSRYSPGGAWDAYASASVGNAVEEINALTGNATGLVHGTNVLAAEVHQIGLNNSDMVFGIRLKIESPPLDSATWRTIHFGSSSNSGTAADLADPDNDGQTNLKEFALCTNPNQFDAWCKVAATPPNLTVTYLRRKSALSELNIQSTCSTDTFGPWSNSGITDQILADDGMVETVETRVAMSGDRKFVQIQVTRPVTLPLPAPPSNLVASAISSSGINLTWSDNSANESGFKIERRQSATPNFIEIFQPPIDATSFSDSGLIAGTKYYYKIRATNSGGDSAFSAEANATTQSGYPAPPTNLVATTVSTSQINLTWSDNSNNENGFIVERRQSNTPEFVLIATTSPNTTSYQSGGLLPGTKYYYHIRATNAVADSANTPDVTATTINSVPTAPSDLTATVNSSSQINLAWTDNSTNETAFKVERRKSGDPGFIEIATLAADVVNYQSSGLAASTKYYFRIRAFNPVGDSAYCAEANATTHGVVPAAPSNLVAIAVSTSQINLSWTDNASNETGFRIERKTGTTGSYAEIGTTGSDTMSFNSTGLAAGNSYYFRVRATNAAGDSIYSNEINGTTHPPGGQTITPAILTSGYSDILDLQITGTSENWLISDVSTRQLQDGYEWWYFVGSKIIKTSSNLSNMPWKGNHPGRVLKMAGKIGLDTFNRWGPGGGYYDSNAGMYFQNGDVGGATTFMFK